MVDSLDLEYLTICSLSYIEMIRLVSYSKKILTISFQSAENETHWVCFLTELLHDLEVVYTSSATSA